jgi:hypothetical protein
VKQLSFSTLAVQQKEIYNGVLSCSVYIGYFLNWWFLQCIKGLQQILVFILSGFSFLWTCWSSRSSHSRFQDKLYGLVNLKVFNCSWTLVLDDSLWWNVAINITKKNQRFTQITVDTRIVDILMFTCLPVAIFLPYALILICIFRSFHYVWQYL